MASHVISKIGNLVLHFPKLASTALTVNQLFSATHMDRFHWKGHVGCSSGYNLAIYKSALTNTINSQSNKQANAGLQYTKSQVAYLSHANFMHTVSLFLAIKNLDVTKKLQDDHQYD